MQAQSKAKNLWEISERDFPLNGTQIEKLKFLIQYALLAPSSHNTQPWLFKIQNENAIEIYSDQTRWLKIADRDQREMHISIGCTLENLLVAARHFGFETKANYFPQSENKNLIAVILLRQSEQPIKDELFPFLTSRSTFHGTFLDKPINADLQREIENCCTENGIHLYLTNNEKIREKVHDLIVRSDALHFADPAFREELSYWIGQGVFGNSWLMAQIGSLAVAYLDLGKSTAKSDRKVLQSAPVLGLITSKENDRISHVKTGQVFERIYLTARKFGLGV
ncbi:MAG TPA: nitroreductase family protein, partial [Pyrinomonadaceae bacterium]|nr:nitroreductase family protein [Pyrinomonadaceae bacterium]